MGFGAELKGFASGFRQGVQLANQTRDSQTTEYRYGRPKEKDINAQPGLSEGTDVTIGTKERTDNTKTSSTAKPGEIEAFIRARAKVYNIDPDIAVKVAMSEGGVSDPTRQSEYVNPKTGKREESYGPFQLYLGGGLGNKALKLGIDPRNPDHWKRATDFALSEAAKSGWGQWYGAAKAGIDDWDGIGGSARSPSSVGDHDVGGSSDPSISPDSFDVGVLPDDEEEEDDGGGGPDIGGGGTIDEEGNPVVDPAEVSWYLPEVDLPEITVPQVEYGTPTMFAARGGVIPEFAEGGPVEPTPAPRPNPDPYNHNRNYTQPIANDRPTFVPRRISQPAVQTTTPLGTRTTSQLALDAARAKAAAAAAAPVVAAKPGNTANLSEADKWKKYNQFLNTMGPQTLPGGRVGQNEGHHPNKGKIIDPNVDARKYWYSDAGQQAFMSGEGVDPKYQTGYDRVMAKKPSRFSGVWGGAYNFKKGGSVPSVSPEYWEEAVARERRRPGQMSDQDARDLAAKRLNRRERGLTSTAVNVGGKKEGGGGGGGGGGKIKTKPKTDDTTTSSVPIPTPRPRPDLPGITQPNVPPTKVLKEPRTKDDLVIPEPTPPYRDDEVRHRQDDPRGPIPLQEPDNGRERDTSIGPGVELAIPDPTQVEPAVAPPNVPLRPQVEPAPPSVPPAPQPALPQPDASAAEPAVAPPNVPQPRLQATPPNVPPPAQPGLPRPDASAAEPSTAPPQVTPEVVTNILNDAVATGPGSPQLDMAAIKSTIVDAIQNGSEQAKAKIQEWVDLLNARLGDQGIEPAAGPRGALPEPGEPGAGGRPHAQSTGQYNWRDFLNMFMQKGYEFAEGGVVPEEDEEIFQRPKSQHDAGYTTSAPGARSPSSAGVEPEARPAKANVKPTKKLLDDVAVALDGGVKFLTRHFGLNQEGAVPSPEDEPRQREGIMRFVKGEGAATPEELKGIDDKIDPNRELDEGFRQMNRFAQTMQFFQQAGRKDEAEAAAGSLLQYGAQRFSKLGSVAANQYEQYMRTGDQEYLQGTIKMLEQAYKMVPDGATVDVSINPETNQLQITRIDAQGNEEDVPLKPQDLPGIIKSVQDSSGYWKSIYRLADPAGAKAQDTANRTAAAADLAYERSLDKQRISQEFTSDRDDQRQEASDARWIQNENSRREREDRAAARAEDRFRRANPKIDWTTLGPLQTEVKEAQKALAEDEEDEGLRQAFNEKVSRFLDLAQTQTKDPGRILESMNIWDYEYISAPGAQPGTAEPPADGETPPAEAPAAAPETAATPAQAPGPPPTKYPDAKWAGDHWEVTRDGKTYQLKPRS